MRGPAGGVAVLVALGLLFAAGAYADTGPKPDPAPPSSGSGPSPDPAPQPQPPAPSPPPAPEPTPPPPPPPPVYTPPPAYTPAVQPVQHVTPPAAKPKPAVREKRVRYVGAKLHLPQARPRPAAKPTPRPKPHLSAPVLGTQTRTAPPKTSLAAQSGPAPLRKPEATSAPAVATTSGGGGGSSFALWLLIALGGLGGVLLAGAAIPAHALASYGLQRRLANRRVDVAMTGATMLGCFLVLLAIGR